MFKKNQIKELYEKKLNELSTNFEEIKINTSFGRTNIICCRNSSKPSLVLIHGLNSSAPFALNQLSFLLDNYSVFAIDIPGLPNKSNTKRIPKKGNNYGLWLNEIIKNLNIYNTTFVGISFGSIPILQSLLINEKYIKEVYLISPAGFVYGNLLMSISNFLIPLLKFKILKKEIYSKKCLNSIYDDFDITTKLYFEKVVLNYKVELSLNPNFSFKQISSIQTPMHIVISEDDYFVSAKKIRKKYFKLPNNVKFSFIKKSKHIATKEKYENYFFNSTT